MTTDTTILDLEKALKDKSPWYTELHPKWEKTRIIFKGEDAVHEAGELLLDKLQQQDPEEYQKYVNRTRFLNAFKRTVSGLEGTVKRKDADFDVQSIDDLIEDIDLSGTTLDEYSNKLLHEGVKIGLCGTLVDYNYIFSNEQDEELTVAQAEEMELRPKLSFYISDNIYKVRFGRINGKVQIVLVVLKETYEEEVNEFETEEKDQYRVLSFNEDGNYFQRLYKVVESGVNIEISDDIIPMMNNKPLKEIPFYLHGEFIEPPLYDLVTTNIKHYQLKADHNHVLHFVGLPQPWRTGVDPNDNKLPTTIGSPVVWDIESDKAKIGYLELEAKGVSAITEELDSIKEEMAFLGAAILVSDQMVNETATKANLRNASETSSLVDIVISLSNSFTKALKKLAEWHGKPDSDTYYIYNQDFDINKLTAQEILARVQSWQSGAFSKRSLYKQLKDGEVEMVGETFEDEEELINKTE